MAHKNKWRRFLKTNFNLTLKQKFIYVCCRHAKKSKRFYIKNQIQQSSYMNYLNLRTQKIFLNI